MKQQPRLTERTAMADTVRVHPEHLLVSAVTADIHADDLHLQHGAADARIESAQTGMPAMAAAAMSVKVAEWQAVTAALRANIGDHGNALRASGIAFHDAELENAQRLDALAAEATDTPIDR
ncbi:hypothetical protein DVS77_21710 [Mycolicibacterium moriokaense]|nr:hypothetical protein DVS77_21710 [Mycolicibacterium moriokaense]